MNSAQFGYRRHGCLVTLIPPFFKIDGYNLISQGKMCSSHGGLAIYISENFNFSTIDLNINSQIWEGQFIEIANVESNK